jgi:hypothetical protein
VAYFVKIAKHQAPLRMPTPLTLNDLLLKGEIDPRKVIVVRHRPTEKTLQKLLPWWVHETPALFNAYQSSHGPRLEAAMAKLVGTGFLASFIGIQPGEAVFAGISKIGGSRPLNYKEFWDLPENKELRTYGMFAPAEKESRRTRIWFALEEQKYLSEWVGKLTIAWPPPERAWWRRAERNEFRVISISGESRFAGKMTDWRQIVLTWPELQTLPTTWREALKHWRGIYLIHDSADGKNYVGSAYGSENILGRWLNYAKTGDGGNKHLRARKPESFEFSILERVSPDMLSEDVIRLEATWKTRLHTRWPDGLNDN